MRVEALRGSYGTEKRVVAANRLEHVLTER